MPVNVIIMWITQRASIIASSSASWAFIWHVTNTSGSPAMLTLFSLCSLLPQGIVSNFAGAYADKHDKKRVIIASDIGTGIASLILAFLLFSDAFSIVIICLFCMMRSVMNAFHSPAVLSLMPSLVSRKDLLTINAMDQAFEGANSILSPIIGIFLYESLGLSLLLIIDFVGALVAVTGLIWIKTPKGDYSQFSTTKKMLEGWHVLRKSPNLSILIITLGVGMVTFSPVAMLLPMITNSHFGGGAARTSIIEAIYGVGVLIGSIILAVRGNKGMYRLACVSSIFVGTVIAICGLLSSSSYFIFAILVFLASVGTAFFSGPLITLIQSKAPVDLLGSIMGVTTSIFGIFGPIGIAIGGFIAERIGISLFYFVDGIAIALMGVLFSLLGRIKNC